MKTRNIISIAVLAVMGLVACQEVPTVQPSSKEVSTVSFTAKDFICEDGMDDGLTRTSYTVASTGIKFAWSEKDTVGIFPVEGSQVYFSMKGGAGTPTASFTGGGWALLGDTKYMSYFPFIGDMYLDKKNLPVHYDGQVQTDNGSTAHLGDFDFRAAAGTTAVSGGLTFEYDAMAAIVEFKFNIGQGGYKQISLLTSDGDLFTVDGSYDLTADVPMVKPAHKASSINLGLKDVNIMPGDSILLCYMMVAPVDLTGKTLAVAVIDTLDNVKTYPVTGKNIRAGHAYRFTTSEYDVVNIPDSNFRAYLVEHFDLDNDGSISVKEASLITEIEVNTDNIASVAGIEMMPNLVSLKVSGTSMSSKGKLTSIDLSGNPQLETLYCEYNSLTTLDLSKLPALKVLKCGYNELTSITFCNNTSLYYITCSSNRLTELDLTPNAGLTTLYCNNNDLSTLILTEQTLLKTLQCRSNNFTRLDISTNTALETFNCLYNDYLTYIYVWEGFNSQTHSGFAKDDQAIYMEKNNVVNLSASGTANCYIAPVSKVYKYTFKANVKGNSTESLGELFGHYVVWEADNSATKVSSGAIISDVTLNSETGMISFKAVSEGNAIIGVKNNLGQTIWSWHIWVTDYDPSKTNVTYAASGAIMMDRNLGALSAAPGDSLALGLMYQWGRKDPMIGSSSVSEPLVAPISKWYESPVVSSSYFSLAYTFKYPAVFITSGENSAGDWLYGGHDATMWGSTKTKYDPCPVGWRVPDGGQNGAWKNMYDNYDFDAAHHGLTLPTPLVSAATWYPAVGFIDGANGNLTGTGTYGYYWTCTPSADDKSYFTMISSEGLPMVYSLSMKRSHGCAVRCCKE